MDTNTSTNTRRNLDAPPKVHLPNPSTIKLGLWFVATFLVGGLFFQVLHIERGFDYYAVIARHWIWLFAGLMLWSPLGLPQWFMQGKSTRIVMAITPLVLAWGSWNFGTDMTFGDWLFSGYFT